MQRHPIFFFMSLLSSAVVALSTVSDAMMEDECASSLGKREASFEDRGAAAQRPRNSEYGAAGAALTPPETLMDQPSPVSLERHAFLTLKEKVCSDSQDRVQDYYTLGRFYEQGLGVDPNLVQAHYWYSLAANHNDAQAQCSLGRFFELGLGGVVRNLFTARHWYRQAANQGHEQAAEALRAMMR